MSDPWEDRAKALLEEAGAQFVRQAKHGKLYAIGKQRVTLPGTASDHRAWKNTVRDIKHAIAAHEADQKEHEVNNPEPASRLFKPLAVETTVKVIRETTHSLALDYQTFCGILRDRGVFLPTDAKIKLNEHGSPLLEISWSEISEETE